MSKSKKMMNTTLYQIAFVMLFMLIACGSGIPNREISPEKQEYYERLKRNFEPGQIDHFPEKLVSEVATIQFLHEIEKNDINLMLYEFELSDKQIELIREKFEAMEGVKKYHSSDSNLLYVVSNMPDVSISLRQKNNLNSRSKTSLPVVALNNYPLNNPEFDKMANREFDIYVVDAKPDKVEKFSDLPPNANMPSKWQNGISKGVSINEKDKMAVFWTVIW